MRGSERRFWEWFEKHQDELFDFELDRERIFDRLSNRLARVHRDLTFEFGPKEDDHREFVISAGGLKRAFPAVSSLVSAAPHLNFWRIIAFRPRRYPLNRIQIGDKCIEPDDLEFSLFTASSAIGVQLFLPGFREDDVILKQIGYLMLDEALGEYDVETRIGPIKFLPRESPRAIDRHPFSELPRHFDQLALSLAGPTLPN